MNLEQLAYFAQIVGVLGLIASLAYVGQQLRLSREQMQHDAESRFYQWAYEVFSGVSHDRDFATVWTKGESELDGLDAVDRRRAINQSIGGLFMWSQWYSLNQKGLLPQQSRQALELWFKTIGQRQSIREAWRFSKDGFDEAFRRFAAPYLE